ncbi:WD40 repeat-like protein [Xylariaceae sp. FL0594]|nr:WD40 repeat-like protein [Xylariaceae sp. FL0594]
MPPISTLTVNASDSVSSATAVPDRGSTVPLHSNSHSISASASASATTARSARGNNASTTSPADGPTNHVFRPGTRSSDAGTSIPTDHTPAQRDSVKADDKGSAALAGGVAVALVNDNTNTNTKNDSAAGKDQRANGRSAPSSAPVSASPALVSTVDPLSHHIFTRTNTGHSIASRILLSSARPDSPGNESLPRQSSDIPSKLATAQPDPTKEKKKGVSFLSRLSMIGGKKRDDDAPDDESELGEQRTEGANAVAFSSAAYIPLHKEPPRYIRVRAQHKRVKEFNRMFLAQELAGTKPTTSDSGKPLVSEPTKADQTSGGPIWAVGFSQDGRYLATGGRDRVLRVWAVIATEEDRKAYNEEDNANAEKEERLSAPVFHPKPAREFIGHEGDILALSWSKNNFLLSSSMDKTVRLWHMSRQECLCTFKHKDFVTSIAFHPRDDRFFLAGSLDSSLRLWSIPDKAVAFSSQLSDIITAVAFSPDGKTAIAGCLNGYCMFYETEGLKSLHQLHVRSSRGKNAKGSKITGIHAMEASPGRPDSEVNLLITSNDSRIRIYNLADRTLKAKLRGHENACNQIRASFSDDGNYVICGSEDGRTFIWSKGLGDADSREKRPCEYFEAHSEIVTAAIFAPTKTRQLLQASLDPIFTLCNPPPITLRSRDESTANLTLSVCDAQSEHSAKVSKPEESPAFIARSNHYDGNIVVTTDHSGLIKVFRQDCAFVKRRHETWETGSTFSRKLGRDGMFGRAGSIMTRTSMGSRDPQSRRSSLSHVFQNSTDRIDTWRLGVEGDVSRPSLYLPTPTTTATPTRSERSLSPHKVPRTPVSPGRTNAESEVRKPPETSSPSLPPTSPTSPTISVQSSRISEYGRGDAPAPPTPGFAFRSFEDQAGDMRNDGAGAGYSFWNLNKWRNIGQSRNHASGNDNNETDRRGRSENDLLRPSEIGAAAAAPHHRSPSWRRTSRTDVVGEEGRGDHHGDRRWSYNVNRIWSPPPLEEERDDENTATHEKDDQGSQFLSPPENPAARARTGSVGSALSSELTATSDEGEQRECVKCGSRDFRAKRVSGKQRLLCGRCGRMVDE